MNKIEFLIIHHEAGNQGLYGVNEFHKQKFNFISKLDWFVGYHYYCDKLGKITQTRTDDEIGAHTLGYNENLGICLQGDFNNEQPTTNQRHALRLWIKQKMKQYNISANNVKGHRNFRDTSCCGKNLPDNELKEMALYEEDIKEDEIKELEKQISLLQQIINKLKEWLNYKK